MLLGGVDVQSSDPVLNDFCNVTLFVMYNLFSLLKEPKNKSLYEQIILISQLNTLEKPLWKSKNFETNIYVKEETEQKVSIINKEISA